MRLLTAHLVGGSSPGTVVFPVIRRPLVGWVSFGPSGGSGTVSSSVCSSSSIGGPFTVRDVLKPVTREPGRSSPASLVVTSHHAHAYSRSPSMMYSFAKNAASLHHAPDCNHVSWKERRHKVCPNEARTSILRLSEPSPPVLRLCRAASTCSRSSRDCHGGGS